MDPNTTVALVLVLCLVLVVAVYYLGVVTGKAICKAGPPGPAGSA